MKKALILDLDNTIYPVSSIAADFFNDLFKLLEQNPDILKGENLEAAKDELQRRPFHLVAAKFNFGEDLTNKGMDMLRNFRFEGPMQPFDDYHKIKTIPLTKFLVTTGFTNLQWSKVQKLDIEQDFEEIHIVDPDISTKTKKDVFADILKRFNYKPADVLVIGDDPESEIKAATELGIDTFLFDYSGKHWGAAATFHSVDLADVLNYLS